MNKKLLKISVLVFSMSMFVSSCSKNDEPIPSTPTKGKTTAVFNPSITYGSMTDQDGNIYKTVTIGTQIWMAENLRVTHYNDGTSIPNITDNTAWSNLTTGAYCNYKNTVNIDTIATYGRLYNWYSVNTAKLAPIGWHVPTNAEWTTLTTYLGGESVAGVKLKEIGTTHWATPNTGATNETGFTAIPAGNRYNSGTFPNIGLSAYLWSITENDAASAWARFMDYSFSKVANYNYPKQVGFSVRCIKD